MTSNSKLFSRDRIFRHRASTKRQIVWEAAHEAHKLSVCSHLQQVTTEDGAGTRATLPPVQYRATFEVPTNADKCDALGYGPRFAPPIAEVWSDAAEPRLRRSDARRSGFHQKPGSTRPCSNNNEDAKSRSRPNRLPIDNVDNRLIDQAHAVPQYISRWPSNKERTLPDANCRSRSQFPIGRHHRRRSLCASGRVRRSSSSAGPQANELPLLFTNSATTRWLFGTALTAFRRRRRRRRPSERCCLPA